MSEGPRRLPILAMTALIIGATVVATRLQLVSSFVSFAVIVTSVTINWQLYVYKRWVRPCKSAALSRVHLLFALLSIAAPYLGKGLAALDENWLVVVSYATLPVNTWLFFVAWPLSWLVRRVRHVSPRTELLVVATLVVFASAAAHYEARYMHEVSEHHVPLRGLGRSGARIVMLSDLHLGPVLRLRFCHDVLARVRALQPDAICIVGDLVDAHVDAIHGIVEQCLRDFSRLAPTYYVSGNHELYTGSLEAWMRVLRDEAGFQVLQNGCAVLPGVMGVVGINELTGARLSSAAAPDERKAFADCANVAGLDAAMPLLVLAHQPNHVDQVAAALGEAHPSGRDALMLAGHTHGGQFWPLTVLVGLFNEFAQGLHRHSANLMILVGRGVGQWGPVARLGARAEILVVRVTRA